MKTLKEKFKINGLDRIKKIFNVELFFWEKMELLEWIYNELGEEPSPSGPPDINEMLGYYDSDEILSYIDDSEINDYVTNYRPYLLEQICDNNDAYVKINDIEDYEIESLVDGLSYKKLNFLLDVIHEKDPALFGEYFTEISPMPKE